MSTFSFAVITMSDSGARGEREDTSGTSLIHLFQEQGYILNKYAIVPDTIAAIVDTILAIFDNDSVDLILTTGGTGVSPTDVTPEAMDQIFEREVPGMAEAMRAASLKITPRAVLSRGRAGIRDRTLIINLPGSKKAALENIAALLPALPHAIEKIKGSSVDCGNH